MRLENLQVYLIDTFCQKLHIMYLMLCSISDVNKAGTLSIYEMNQDININDVIELIYSVKATGNL